LEALALGDKGFPFYHGFVRHEESHVLAYFQAKLTQDKWIASLKFQSSTCYPPSHFHLPKRVSKKCLSLI
jgi:hypothetical protein